MSFDVNPTTRRAIVGFLVVGLPILVLSWIWWGTPPQIGGDREVIDTVDALFTAVTSRDENRLAQCERRLNALSDSRKLSRATSDYLDGIIKTARTGKWRRAAERLYSFMKAQRRTNA